jgi:Transposase DDE domain
VELARGDPTAAVTRAREAHGHAAPFAASWPGVRQIISAHDPEMRHGRKTPSRRFTGYKLHGAAATQAPILTAIVLSAGNENDGHHGGALIDQQPEGRRPKRFIGDTADGNVEARELLEQRHVSVLTPVHSSSPKDGTIPKDQLEIDLENDTVTCPEGHTREADLKAEG